MPIPLAATLIASRRRAVLQNILGKWKTAQRTSSYTIVGITRDNTGQVLINAAVKCFEVGTDRKIVDGFSDGSGIYTFNLAQNSGFFYCTAYKAGPPNFVGSTDYFVVGVDPVTQAPITLSVDVYLDMENSTDGTVVSNAIAAAGTHGSVGAWHSRNGLTDDAALDQLFVSTAQEIKLRKPIKVGSTTYDDVGSTRSWKMHNSVDIQHMRYLFTSTKAKVSVGFAIYFSSSGVGWGTDFNLYDIMSFTAGSEFTVLSLENKSTGNGPFMLRCHTNSGFDHGNGTGLSGQTCYPVQDKWYWVTMIHNQFDQSKISIYDMVTWNELQNSPMTLENGTTPAPADYFAVGRTDGHGTSHINADYYVDDLIIDTTNAAFPLYPT